MKAIGWMVMWHETTDCKIHMKRFANKADAERFADAKRNDAAVYDLCVSEELAI